MIAGVAAGLAEYFNIDPALTRLGFVLLFLAGGGGFLVYIIMWIVIPTKSQLKKKSNEYIKANTEEIKAKAEALVSGSTSTGINPVGLIFVAIGVFFLLSNFGLFDWLNLGKLWPVFLVILGIFALRRS